MTISNSASGAYKAALAGLVIAVSAITAPAPATARAPDAHSARTSLDWPGTYTGDAPERTTLTLTDAGRFKLVEARGATGRFRWDKSGSIVVLQGAGRGRRFFVSEGYVVELARGATQPGHNSAGHLAKIAGADGGKLQFHGDGAHLGITPGTVEQARGTIRFRGVMTFDKVMPGGHRSLSATYRITCKTRHYTMPEVTYYTGANGGGHVVVKIRRNTNPPLPFTGPSDVLAQAATAYCLAR